MHLPKTLAGVTLAALLLCAAPTLADRGPVESPRVWSYKPDRGYVDDAMALDSKDARFAYVHTDAATFLKVVVVDLGTGKPGQEIDVKDTRIVPQQLHFSSDDKKLLLFFMDGYEGTQGVVVIDPATGKVLDRLGPATRAELVLVEGEQMVSLTNERVDPRGGKVYSVHLYRVRDLTKVRNTAVAVGADGMIRAPEMRLYYFEPGHVALMGLREGKYDKAKDIRLPDRAVRYDLLARKELWGASPDKLMKWTKALNMRPNHPGQYRFLQVSENLKALHHVDIHNTLTDVTLPVKWSLYEARSLTQRERWDGQRLLFSMTIDPVNPDAVARKKADPERVDLYELSKDGKPTLLGQVYTQSRRFAWRVGKDHFAYLRKLKGFERGGVEVSLHKLRN